MVVCHCEAVNDRTIHDALQRGSTSLEEIARSCGAGSQCGGCIDTIQGLVASRRDVAVSLPG